MSCYCKNRNKILKKLWREEFLFKLCIQNIDIIKKINQQNMGLITNYFFRREMDFKPFERDLYMILRMIGNKSIYLCYIYIGKRVAVLLQKE
jgi:hypothetical protein